MESPEPSYWPDPLDSIEPMDTSDAYREASIRCLGLLNRVMLTILNGRMSAVTFWQVAFALGLPITEGRSMADVGKELGVTRAAMSKGQQHYRRALGLPPNLNGKSADACATYSRERNSQMQKKL